MKKSYAFKLSKKRNLQSVIGVKYTEKKAIVLKKNRTILRLKALN
ncbi:hypothetical protein [Draconibacterium halophilum]|nr:hypothetical protein [Draconibacterium halophilum]